MFKRWGYIVVGVILATLLSGCGPDDNPPAEVVRADGDIIWTGQVQTGDVIWTREKAAVAEPITWVQSTLPGDWPVYDAVGIIDVWAARSDWRVGKCPANAWRCYKISPQAEIKCGTVVSMGCTWNASKTPVTKIDVNKAKKIKEYDRATRLWLLVHEMAHAANVKEHGTACWQASYYTRRCNGKVPGLGFSAAEKERMVRW